MKSLPLEPVVGWINKNLKHLQGSPNKLRMYCSSKGLLKCLFIVSIFDALLIQTYNAVMNMNIFWDAYIYSLAYVTKWIL